MKSIVLVTGGFDPLHEGHIEYFKNAKNLGDLLVVGINSNAWLDRKKGFYFMDWDSRANIIDNLEMVDKVISFEDSDGTAKDAIMRCLKNSSNVTFANGGDRSKENIPELDYFNNDKRVKFKFGIGGSIKKNSSSLLTNKLKNKKTIKPWGSYEILSSESGHKTKIIKVMPNESLSLQFHKRRDEHWIVVQGFGEITLDNEISKIKKNHHIYIKREMNHRIRNIGKSDLIFIEVSIGNYIEEDDIVRLDDKYGR